MNDKLIAIYMHFLETKDSISSTCKLAPYDWYKLPDKLPGQWIGYIVMLVEHSRELANSINELRRYIINLEAWNTVLDTIKDKNEKDEVILEFIEPFATLSINMSYVIRSRFIYSITHLCNQANLIKQKEWIDDIPLDREIYFDTADKCSVSWKGYKDLKLALEGIINQEYRSKTYDFRDKYNHRFSPRIEFGVIEIVERIVSKKDGKVSYIVSPTDPLKLNKLLPILIKQHEKCLKAFVEYQKLVNEHIAAIS